MQYYYSSKFLDKPMDFDQLYQLLPKPSMTWTVNDIEIWLRFIGL